MEHFNERGDQHFTIKLIVHYRLPLRVFHDTGLREPNTNLKKINTYKHFYFSTPELSSSDLLGATKIGKNGSQQPLLFYETCHIYFLI